MKTKNEWKELAITFVLVCFVLLIGIIVLVIQRDNAIREVEDLELRCKVVEWNCPTLFEKGTYDFTSDGYLISPSGIKLKCKEIE